MKFDNIMIVTDLDGTFGSAAVGIAPGNAEAVEYFTKNGGIFTAASGRVPTSMGIWSGVGDLVNAPAILCNGGFLYDFTREERIMQVELNREKVIELVNYVKREFPDVGIRCSLAHGETRLKGEECLEDFEGWTRVSFEADSDVLDSMREPIEARYKDYFSFMKASHDIYEFQSTEATKSKGLQRLRSYLADCGRVSDNLNIYAVGDFENDLDLLAYADIPCCPENAIDSVKAIAKIQLCHCKNGAIADLISRIEREEC